MCWLLDSRNCIRWFLLCCMNASGVLKLLLGYNVSHIWNCLLLFLFLVNGKMTIILMNLTSCPSCRYLFVLCYHVFLGDVHDTHLAKLHVPSYVSNLFHGPCVPEAEPMSWVLLAWSDNLNLMRLIRFLADFLSRSGLNFKSIRADRLVSLVTNLQLSQIVLTLNPGLQTG